MQFALIAIVVLAVVISVLLQSLALFVVTMVSLGVAIVVLVILKERYFASEEFLKVKEEIHDVVEEHNDISDYVQEIRKKSEISSQSSQLLIQRMINHLHAIINQIVAY